jgi:hypothetical protein
MVSRAARVSKQPITISGCKCRSLEPAYSGRNVCGVSTLGIAVHRSPQNKLIRLTSTIALLSETSPFFSQLQGNWGKDLKVSGFPHAMVVHEKLCLALAGRGYNEAPS